MLRSPIVATAIWGFPWEASSFHIKHKYGAVFSLCLNLWQAKKDEFIRQSLDLNLVSDLDLKGSAAAAVYMNLYSLINQTNELVFLSLMPVAVWSLEWALWSLRLSAAEIFWDLATRLLWKTQVQRVFCWCSVPFCVLPTMYYSFAWVKTALSNVF